MSELTDAFPHLATERRFFEVPTAARIANGSSAKELAHVVYQACVKKKRQDDGTCDDGSQSDKKN